MLLQFSTGLAWLFGLSGLVWPCLVDWFEVWVAFSGSELRFQNEPGCIRMRRSPDLASMSAEVTDRQVENGTERQRAARQRCWIVVAQGGRMLWWQLRYEKQAKSAPDPLFRSFCVGFCSKSAKQKDIPLFPTIMHVDWGLAQKFNRKL